MAHECNSKRNSILSPKPGFEKTCWLNPINGPMRWVLLVFVAFVVFSDIAPSTSAPCQLSGLNRARHKTRLPFHCKWSIEHAQQSNENPNMQICQVFHLFRLLTNTNAGVYKPSRRRTRYSLNHHVNNKISNNLTAFHAAPAVVAHVATAYGSCSILDKTVVRGALVARADRAWGCIQITMGSGRTRRFSASEIHHNLFNPWWRVQQ